MQRLYIIQRNIKVRKDKEKIEGNKEVFDEVLEIPVLFMKVQQIDLG